MKSERKTADYPFGLVASPVPALMFHSVCIPFSKAERDWYIAPERFQRFIAWLAERGYQSLTPLDWMAGKRPARHVILTFDDGYDDFYTGAFPVLERFGLSATVFVVVDRIGKSNSWDEKPGYRSRRLLTLQEIRELHRHGVSFGSHSLTHPFLTLLSDKDLHREVSDSKSRLEDLLGSEVTCFAYPSGRVDTRVRECVAAAGYKTAMSVRHGLNFREDPLWMKRINVSQRDSLLQFALKVTSGRTVPQHMFERLVHGMRVSLDVLPDPLSRALESHIRRMYRSGNGAVRAMKRIAAR